MPDSPERFVKRDQNLFEQRPFNYLNLVVEARQLELRRLRGLLPLVHDFEFRAKLQGVSDEEARRIIAQNNTEIGKLVEEAASQGITGRVRGGSQSRQLLPSYYAFVEAFTETSLHLKDYPKWYEYIQEFTGQKKPWNRYGEPHKSYHWFPGETVPAYEYWSDVQKEEIERRVVREERIRRLEILTVLVDIFPQDFASEATSHPSLKEGKRKGRSWRLLRGANLLPEPGRGTLKINTRTNPKKPEFPA